MADPVALLINEMTIEQLRGELESAREILMSIGSGYYMLALMKDGLGKIPEEMPIPVEWAKQAHALMEGKTLQGEILGQIKVQDPDKVYSATFQDKKNHIWLFFFDRLSKEVQLRTEGPEKDPKTMPQETKLWLSACFLVCGMTHASFKIEPLPELGMLRADLGSDAPPLQADPSATNGNHNK